MPRGSLRGGILFHSAAMLAAMALAPTQPAHALCRQMQLNAGRRVLQRLGCVQAELPPGPPGPPGPKGDPGTLQLAFVDGVLSLLPGSADCAVAECAPGDRIVSCGALNADTSTVMISAVGLRDPEDDTASNLLSADTCFACFDNANTFTVVSVVARAVCAVGGKSQSFGVNGSSAPRRPGYAEFRELTANVARR